jgi:dTDP-4-dehydrorhamnose 3,5-epimerase
MKFVETPLPGACLIEPSIIPDDRGFFAYAYVHEDFEAAGLEPRIAQVNISYNTRRHTLRGLHFQLPPHAEAKTVRCVRGAIWDVVVDLRPDSPTFTQWFAAELTAENRRALHVPVGCAHGFQTLTDDTEVLYLVSARYTPSHYRGVRWNDPAFGITWPETADRIVNERDASYPDFQP